MARFEFDSDVRLDGDLAATSPDVLARIADLPNGRIELSGHWYDGCPDCVAALLDPEG